MKNFMPDLIAILGFALLACGLWRINQSLALCVVGGLLLAFGLLIAWRNARSAAVDEFRKDKVNHAG